MSLWGNRRGRGLCELEGLCVAGSRGLDVYHSELSDAPEAPNMGPHQSSAATVWPGVGT